MNRLRMAVAEELAERDRAERCAARLLARETDTTIVSKLRLNSGDPRVSVGAFRLRNSC